MSKTATLIPLSQILTKSNSWIDIKPTETYKQVTVKIWGKGVVERNEVTGAEISANTRLKVDAGQFILSRIDARHGAFGLIPESLAGAVVTNDFPVFSLNKSLIIPQFLNWISKTESFIELCKAASEGTTNRIRLKESKFLSMEISLPPLEEQRRIVGRIEELAGKIAEARGLRERSIEESNNLYPATLTSIMQSHQEDWTQESVSDVVIDISAGWSPQCDGYPASDGEWGVLKTTSVQWNKFIANENKALPKSMQPRPSLTVQKGDVLVTRAGPRQRVGVVAAARENHSNLMISDKIIRLKPDLHKIDPRFL